MSPGEKIMWEEIIEERSVNLEEGKQIDES